MSSLRSNRWDVWYSLLVVGAGTALAGLAAATLALWFIGIQSTVLALAASLAAVLLGPGLWWWMIIKPDRLSIRRGIGVGVLGACLAHPLAWYIALALARLTGARTLVGLDFSAANPVQDLVAALVLAGISLFLVGWITVLIGGVVGGVIARLQSVSGCPRRWRAALFKYA